MPFVRSLYIMLDKMRSRSAGDNFTAIVGHQTVGNAFEKGRFVLDSYYPGDRNLTLEIRALLLSLRPLYNVVGVSFRPSFVIKKGERVSTGGTSREEVKEFLRRPEGDLAQYPLTRNQPINPQQIKESMALL